MHAAPWDVDTGEKLLVVKPSSESLVGAGKRAATLRSRVRMARRYLAWLSVNFKETFPARVGHLTEYLRVRVSEPCNRGAPRNAIVGLDSWMKLPESRQKHQLQGIHYILFIFHEMLSKAIPRRPSKQAPRTLAALLLAFVKFLMDPSNLPYMRVYAWFMAHQNWATLRFSDHRGVLPDSIAGRPSRFTAVLSRSKTLGSDKNVLSRPLRGDISCFVAELPWMETGLRLLGELAPFLCDYLMPAFEKNFTGCRSLELKYEIGYAFQNRIMALLSLKNTPLFPVPVTSSQFEYAAWILEQTLASKQKKVDCMLVCPEDLGGHQHHGPASIWQLRDFQVLECDHDARRGAGFFCQLAHAETKRPGSFLWDG